MATRSRRPRGGRGIVRFRTRPQPYDPERSSREFAGRLRASYERLRADPEAWRAELEERAAWDPMLVHPWDWDQLHRAVGIARDIAREIFGDQLRDFEVEHTQIHDTDEEVLCFIVSIDASEETFLSLRSEYHRALDSVLSPAELSHILISVEYA